MTLISGTKLGTYEIISLLGKGGMGEVYRARDTKLDRDVAVKTLPEEFARDTDRAARFEREAKLLASVNHPSIGAIHGIEESNGNRFLVLELIDGETIADRIARGPIPVEESLKIAAQIAEALEAAHENGVLHRDLKPANIKITRERRVKVLDFGLAKAIGDSAADANISNSPTLSIAGTQQGIILGTAAYMSPEQARGEIVDRRTDIWAFGCVLFEMLTSRRTFDGRTVSDVLASVLKSDPAWNSLPPNLHPRIRLLLERCLQKEPKDRYNGIGDARVDIQDVLRDPRGVAPAAETTKAGRSKLLWAASIVAAALLSGLFVWIIMQPDPAQVLRLSLIHPSEEIIQTPNDTDVAISPDGLRVAYIAANGVNGGPLYVWELDQREPRILADLARSPFFSQDGQWVGFAWPGGGGEPPALYRVAITGGAPVLIGGLTNNLRGASWGADGDIIFAMSPNNLNVTTRENAMGLRRIPFGGGETAVLTTPDIDEGEGLHLFPEILPNGKGVLFTIVGMDGNLDAARIAVLNLETGNYQAVITGGSNGRFAASGHIVYAAAGTLRAAAFDPDSLQVNGTPTPVEDGVVMKGTGASSFGISYDGKLVYMAGAVLDQRQRTLVWVDRQNDQEESISVPQRAYVYPRLSHDGSRAALDIREPDSSDISILTLTTPPNLNRFTFGGDANRFPLWSMDGDRIVFMSVKDGSERMYWQAADGSGSPELVTPQGPDIQAPTSFSRDGQYLVFTTPTTVPHDIGMVHLQSERVEMLLEDPAANELNGKVSPDGRWLAYESSEGGGQSPQVFVRPFPNVRDGGPWQVSTGGGTRPLWAKNGRELFYYFAPGQVWAVPVDATGSAFKHGNPELIIDGQYVSPYNGHTYDVSHDGQRFLMIKAAPRDANARPPQLNVVLNWFEELKRRVPVP